MMRQTGYQRSEHLYALPDPKLVGMDGQATTLLAELNPGKPVMVNFIFTTCTTICPVMTGVFSQVQKELGPEAEKVRMISFSIDPEYDTPERLREYAQRFNAGPEWHFFTGDPQEILAVQRAFDVYRGNKMNHEPTTLLRRSEGEPWVRVDGIASAAELAAEYHRLVHR
jgi:protein SCO1/2